MVLPCPIHSDPEFRILHNVEREEDLNDVPRGGLKSILEHVLQYVLMDIVDSFTRFRMMFVIYKKIQLLSTLILSDGTVNVVPQEIRPFVSLTLSYGQSPQSHTHREERDHLFSCVSGRHSSYLYLCHHNN